MTCSSKPCSIKDCVDTVFCTGLCVLHYFRKRRFGSPTAPALKWRPSGRRGQRGGLKEQPK